MNFKKKVSGSWHDTPHYIHNTSTDTITTLPADIYPNDTTATVGLKGNMQQTATPTPTTPIQPQECGERTGNLINIANISETVTVLYKDSLLMNNIQAGEYTLSFDTTADTAHYVTVGIGATYFSKDIKTISNVQNGYYTMTFTISSENSGKNLYVRFVRFVTTTTITYTVSNIMLNSGSTALPYEPYGYKIPISSASTTVPIYLGEVETTRNIIKYELTGEENWIKETENAYALEGVEQTATGYANALCTHYVLATSYNTLTGTDGTFSVSKRPALFIHDENFTTVTQLKAYLAQQYAAGTPVTVWYVLATEETGIVNEPLMKIGDYADEVANVSIPVTTGGDTISVDTTLQPSEVSVNYKGWHPAIVHERTNGAWT